jgi:eukaryotic-like serine/threonine-protein kinase
MTQQQRYRVIEKLASGGMAEVFRAESAGIEGFKKKVAIKRVLPHLSKKQKFISMFLDEARLSAHLSHSNVVQVFDIGMGDNTYFIVMEYVDGADLKAIAEHRRKLKLEFPVESAAYIATRICEGLCYAHELSDQEGHPFGIVHRDMSPPNVLITKFGEIKIADFGLAKANNQLEKSEPGIIKGKFSYLSPEAAMGQEVDARTDIFAVGIILWELLGGRKLFQGESDYLTVQQVQQAKIPSLTSINPKFPPELDRVLKRALARDPNERYQRAREFARDLNAFLFRHGKPVGPLDIADLVLATMQARQRDKPPSIIDKLIEEALFEFTSLRGSDASPESANAPGRRKFASMHDWASEIKIKNYPTAAGNQAHPEQLLEAGNLAALEDLPSDEPSRPDYAAAPYDPQAPAFVQEQGAVPEPPPEMDPQEGEPQPQPPEQRTSVLMIVAIALVVAVAGVAGAWFSNLIPH